MGVKPGPRTTPSFPGGHDGGHGALFPEARFAAEDLYREDSNRYTQQNVRCQDELAAAAIRLARGSGATDVDPWARSGAIIGDIGCGSGLSRTALEAAGLGHGWVGLDISPEMLEIAAGRRDSSSESNAAAPAAPTAAGALVLSDMGHGLPLRRGVLDAVVSISAVQWLLQGEGSMERTARFFRSLRTVLHDSSSPQLARRSSSGSSGDDPRPVHAVLQCYLPTADAAAQLEAAARAAGFDTALVLDLPHCTPARKYFLLLLLPQPSVPLPLALQHGSSNDGNCSSGGRGVGSGGQSACGLGGVDLAAGASCPLAFYIGGTCSAHWLLSRGFSNHLDPGQSRNSNSSSNSGVNSNSSEQQQQQEEEQQQQQEEEQQQQQQRPMLRVMTGADATVCQFVASHHMRHMRKLMRMLWGGCCSKGITAACLLPLQQTRAAASNSDGSSTRSSEGVCCACGGSLSLAADGFTAHALGAATGVPISDSAAADAAAAAAGGSGSGSSAGTGAAPNGATIARRCSCGYIKILLSVCIPGANGCSDRVALQVVGRTDRLHCLGLSEKLVWSLQQSSIGAGCLQDGNGPSPQQQQQQQEEGVTAALAGRAARAAAAAAAAEAAAEGRRVGAVICEALRTSSHDVITSLPQIMSDHQLLQCEIMHGTDPLQQLISQTCSSWERQQAACAPPPQPPNSSGKRVRRLPPEIPYPLGFNPLIPATATATAAATAPAAVSIAVDAAVPPSSLPVPSATLFSSWQLASNDFQPHAVAITEGLPTNKTAVTAAVSALLTAAAAAETGVYGLQLLLGPDTVTAAAVCYPKRRGATAAEVAPTLLAKLQLQL